MNTWIRLALLAFLLADPVCFSEEIQSSEESPREEPSTQEKSSTAAELFQPPDQAFQAWFPAAPKSEKKENVRFYWVGKGGLYYLINLVANPLVGDESYEVQHLRFDKARDGLKKELGGTLVEDVNFRLANRYEGRMLRFVASEQEVYRIRLYCIGDYFFQVWVQGKPDAVDGESAKRFLDSFYAERQVSLDR